MVVRRGGKGVSCSVVLWLGHSLLVSLCLSTVSFTSASHFVPPEAGQDGKSFSLSFMILIFVNRLGQLFRRMPINLDLYDTSSRIDLGSVLWCQNSA